MKLELDMDNPVDRNLVDYLISRFEDEEEMVLIDMAYDIAHEDKAPEDDEVEASYDAMTARIEALKAARGYVG